MDENFTGIAFCPVCCSNVDVEGGGEQTLTCASCNQEWTMTIDPERFASHAL